VVKVGFIGCGGMAGVHLDKLKQIEDVQIVGLCDIIEEKARVYNQKYGGNVYTDHRVMLDREKSVHSLGYRGLLTDIPENDVDDASSANLKFKSGAVGNFSTTCILNPGVGMGLEIALKHMMIKADSSGYSIISEQPQEVKATNDYLLDIEKSFIEAIKTGDRSKIKCNYEDGMKTLEVTLAVNESIKTGKTIHLK